MEDHATALTEQAQRAARGLLDCAARLSARGWCSGGGGNFSVVVGRDPLRLLVTRSGADKERLSARDLVLVTDAGDPAQAGAARPSAEAPLHATLARLAGAGAVAHTHSVWGTLLGQHFEARGGFRIRGYEMLKGIAGRRGHEEDLLVPVLANSQDVRALCVTFAGAIGQRADLAGLLVAGHGLYAWGPTPDDARRHAEVLEFLFEVVGRRVAFAPFTG
jgi:methylthioribulose-1-phosphate dehydratase